MRGPSSTWAQAGLLLALAALCALVSNATAGASRRLAWLGQPPDTAEPTVPQNPSPQAPAKPSAYAQPDPAQPIRDIPPDAAWELFQAKAPFLDARRRADYLTGHIAGAWNASIWESDLEARLTEFEALARPDSSTPLVLYCSGGDCEDSHLLATRLTELGYRNLLIYRAGYPDWSQQGHPITKGERP